MRKRWQSFRRACSRQALRRRWYKFRDGMRYALGLGPIWVNTTCPVCEREIEIEAD